MSGPPMRLPVRSKPAKRKQGKYKTLTPLLEAGGGSLATSREGSEEPEGALPVPDDASRFDGIHDAFEDDALLGSSGSSRSRFSWSKVILVNRQTKAAKTLLPLVLGGLLLVVWLHLRSRPSGLPLPLLWNGTHPYTPITILLSLDGFRPSYFETHLAHIPHINSLITSPQGIRARSMQPVFPTLTFPNHWALMTGLLPAWSGIIANDFWDPAIEKRNFTIPMKRGVGMVGGGKRQGGKAANLMWPGPPTTSAGVSPSYFVPFQDMTFSDKAHQIMKWIDLPIGDRPDLITAYVPEIDSAGHLESPDSSSVIDALSLADEGVGRLLQDINARNLSGIVNLFIVSDHGGNDRLIFLDDIIGESGMDAIEHRDGWPLAGLRFRAGNNESHYLNLLHQAAEKSDGAFAVYTHETMPARWHFTGSERIAPIYLMPALGWSITNHHELDVLMGGSYTPKGNHGYDNVYEDMQAVFMAHGPIARQLRSKAGSSGMLESFANTEVFSLVLESLGIASAQTAHNGTQGFWVDKLA